MLGGKQFGGPGAELIKAIDGLSASSGGPKPAPWAVSFLRPSNRLRRGAIPPSPAMSLGRRPCCRGGRGSNQCHPGGARVLFTRRRLFAGADRSAKRGGAATPRGDVRPDSHPIQDQGNSADEHHLDRQIAVRAFQSRPFNCADSLTQSSAMVRNSKICFSRLARTHGSTDSATNT